MKALILSGGKGTRLRPITHTGAKQLIPVGNKPILYYGVEAIRDAGITDVGIVVGETEAEIREALGDGSAFGIRTTYIRQDAPLGLAHAVKVSQDFLKQDPFVMYLGDNLILDGITPLVREFERDHPNSQILLAHVANPQEFGVAELDGSRVIRLTEKPKHPRSDLALVGVYMFDPRIFEAVNAIKPSFRNELEITDAIQWLIDHGMEVRCHVITGWWKDTGKLQDMLEANRMVLSRLKRSIRGALGPGTRTEGEVAIGEGTTVENSILRGPLILGERCTIRNSYIGPFTSVYDDVTIQNSEIEHSIVLERCVIQDIPVRIEASLIGKEVRIQRSQLKPTAYRFMVGDSSLVDVL
ncbi:MAG: glucose-1-phosphate thymidylyltransferase [Candidatus Latescibacteria bacterium]|nr:glucose-1-phosphate thymidylyltransferase [Candidatus Latescibacterota bacterium]